MILTAAKLLADKLHTEIGQVFMEDFMAVLQMNPEKGVLFGVYFRFTSVFLSQNPEPNAKHSFKKASDCLLNGYTRVKCVIQSFPLFV